MKKLLSILASVLVCTTLGFADDYAKFNNVLAGSVNASNLNVVGSSISFNGTVMMTKSNGQLQVAAPIVIVEGTNAPVSYASSNDLAVVSVRVGNVEASYTTSAVTNGLYSASNPSGYVTAAVTNGLVTSAVTNGLVTAAVTGGLAAASELYKVKGTGTDVAPNWLVSKILGDMYVTTAPYDNGGHDEWVRIGLDMVVLGAALTNGLVTSSVTNGLVTAAVTNGLVTSVVTNGLVTSAVTNGLYSASNPSGYVTAAVTNGLVTSVVTNGLVTSSVTNGLVTAAGTVSNAFNLSGNPITAFPLLSFDSEISITTTATATLSRAHVCTGTSADYSVFLPAASGNAGRLISLRMASSLTKLVTIDANASENIDGALTRPMWAKESATLLCDGTSWSKIAGKTIPMVAAIELYSGGVTGQVITTSSNTLVRYNTVALQCLAMVETNNFGIRVARGGNAALSFQLYYVEPMTIITGSLDTSNLFVRDFYSQVGEGTHVGATVSANDLLTLHTIHYMEASKTLYGFHKVNIMYYTEIPTW